MAEKQPIIDRGEGLPTPDQSPIDSQEPETTPEALELEKIVKELDKLKSLQKSERTQERAKEIKRLSARKSRLEKKVDEQVKALLQAQKANGDAHGFETNGALENEGAFKKACGLYDKVKLLLEKQKDNPGLTKILEAINEGMEDVDGLTEERIKAFQKAIELIESGNAYEPIEESEEKRPTGHRKLSEIRDLIDGKIDEISVEINKEGGPNYGRLVELREEAIELLQAKKNGLEFAIDRSRNIAGTRIEEKRKVWTDELRRANVQLEGQTKSLSEELALAEKDRNARIGREEPDFAGKKEWLDKEIEYFRKQKNMARELSEVLGAKANLLEKEIALLGKTGDKKNIAELQEELGKTKEELKGLNRKTDSQKSKNTGGLGFDLVGERQADGSVTYTARPASKTHPPKREAAPTPATEPIDLADNNPDIPVDKLEEMQRLALEGDLDREIDAIKTQITQKREELQETKTWQNEHGRKSSEYFFEQSRDKFIKLRNEIGNLEKRLRDLEKRKEESLPKVKTKVLPVSVAETAPTSEPVVATQEPVAPAPPAPNVQPPAPDTKPDEPTVPPRTETQPAQPAQPTQPAQPAQPEQPLPTRDFGGVRLREKNKEGKSWRGIMSIGGLVAGFLGTVSLFRSANKSVETPELKEDSPVAKATEPELAEPLPAESNKTSYVERSVLKSTTKLPTEVERQALADAVEAVKRLFASNDKKPEAEAKSKSLGPDPFAKERAKVVEKDKRKKEKVDYKSYLEKEIESWGREFRAKEMPDGSIVVDIGDSAYYNLTDSALGKVREEMDLGRSEPKYRSPFLSRPNFRESTHLADVGNIKEAIRRWGNEVPKTAERNRAISEQHTKNLKDIGNKVFGGLEKYLSVAEKQFALKWRDRIAATRQEDRTLEEKDFFEKVKDLKE